VESRGGRSCILIVRLSRPTLRKGVDRRFPGRLSRCSTSRKDGLREKSSIRPQDGMVIGPVGWIAGWRHAGHGPIGVG
jgi:hypothetical protein